MKFADFDYKRPDMDTLREEFSSALNKFKSAENPQVAIETIDEIYKIRNDFDTMREIAGIRHTINTENPQYEKEQDFFDQEQPIYAGLINDFYASLITSEWKTDLQKKYGKHLFNIANLSIKTFSPDIVDDLRKENELSTKYRKIKAQANIMFEGKERTFSEMAAFLRKEDREIRKGASAAYWGFMDSKRDEMDQIYHELVQTRASIAKKLGYDNFVQLGYDRLSRTDYDANQVAVFRKQVLDSIVPLATQVRERQAKRIGLDKLKNYDEEFIFRSGNPEPAGDPEWIIDRGREMYEDLSEETGDFINFMLDGELLDLVSKKGKAPGGYCTYINNYRAPFIFSNFNGTAMDIFVLTHEAGHAFQVFMSRHFELNEYNWPTLEACEIHSMSMEFFTWPWMDKFFKEDADKFRFMHVVKALLFLPYGVAVDEFQHHVYANPTETPDQRAASWRAIEKKYLPHRDYDGNEYLESGRFWQVQGHIYESPFYYIDYTLAQICAFQFWLKAEDDRESAFSDYVRLCKAGGSRPFLELVDFANLNSPFKQGTVASVVEGVESWLKNVDDFALESA